MVYLWTYGGGAVLQHVFQALVMLLGSGGFDTTVRVLGLITVVYGVGRAHIAQSIIPGATLWLWFIIASQVLLVPTTTLLIADPIEHKRFVVGQVPWCLAVAAGSLSSFMHALTQQAESLYTTPHYAPYHTSGMVFGARFARAAASARPLSATTSQHLKSFIKRCTIQEALIGARITFDDLKNSTNLWETMQKSAHPTLGFFWNNGTQRTFISCQNAAKRLDTLLKKELGNTMAHIAQHLRGFQALSHAELHIERLAKDQSSQATNIMMHMMVASSVQEGGLLDAPHFSYAQARIQEHWSAQLSWRIVEDILPALKTFFEALAYGAFVFVLLLSLLPGGWKTLGTFFGLLTWVQSWPIFFALLNMLIDAATPAALPLSLQTAPRFFALQQHLVDIAGVFALSIPALSYMILKGGAGAILHLAHHFSAQAQNLASQHASSLASGSSSIANTSINTHQAHQSHAFKMDARAQHHGHATSTVGNDGSQHSLTPDNKLITMQGPGLTLPLLAFSVKSHNSLAQHLSQEASQHKQYASTSLEQFHKSADLAMSKVLSSANQSSLGDQHQTSHGQSLELQKARASENILSFQTYLEKSHGFEKNDAQRIAWGVSLSLPLLPLIGPSASHDSATMSKEALSAIQSKAEALHVRESWQQLSSQQENISSAQLTGVQKQRSEELRKAFQNSAQHLLSWNTAQEESQRLSSAARTAQDKGFHAQSDHTENFVTFAAQHLQVSRLSAINNLNNDPLMRQKLIEEFLRKQVNTITPHIAPSGSQELSKSVQALRTHVHRFLKQNTHMLSAQEEEQSSTLIHKSMALDTIKARPENPKNP